MNELVHSVAAPIRMDSPRFSFRTADFSATEHALRTIGHVVLDDVWNTRFLSDLRVHGKQRFEADDHRHENGEPLQDINGYMGGELGLQALFGPSEAELAEGTKYCEQLSVEFARSGLPSLLRQLLGGTCVLGHSVVSLRRIDPHFPVRFIGLHRDGQLNKCSFYGKTSRLEFTLWTPLQDCDNEDVPRLLLLHRRETIDDVSDDTKDILLLHTDPIKEKDYLSKAGNNVDQFFDWLFREKDCYAPHVPLGSAVLFDHRVVHGSYRTDAMKLPRYSIDMRMVSEFRTTQENCDFVGTAFRAAKYPPRGITLRATNFKRRVGAFVKYDLAAALRKLTG
jgi:hypothetical protein